MSGLSSIERRKLERFFDMGGGYVLDFSNRTFAEFVLESIGRDPYDAKYNCGSSKANRLRGIWAVEPNHVVSKLIRALADYAYEIRRSPETQALADNACKIAQRLDQNGSVPEISSLIAIATEKDFEIVAIEVRDAIDRNKPEAGLDRLHTFVGKYLRSVCEEHGVSAERDNPLHSVLGVYVKHLRSNGKIKSEMTERILKSSISVLESFNHVRNNQTLAHDNPVLGYEEALLIYNHVTGLIRFIRAVEDGLRLEIHTQKQQVESEDFPF